MKRPRRPSDERGETLIEVLAAVALMGVGMTVILTALFTVSVNASINKERTRVAAFLQRWGDAVAAPYNAAGTRNYYDCQAPLTDANSVSTPSGVTATWKVEYLLPSSGGQPDWTNPTWGTQAQCSSNGDQGVQKVTLYATTSGKHDVQDSIVVYRRDTECPPSFDNPYLGPC